MLVGMAHLLVVPLVSLDLIPVGDVRVQGRAFRYDFGCSGEEFYFSGYSVVLL